MDANKVVRIILLMVQMSLIGFIVDGFVGIFKEYPDVFWSCVVMVIVYAIYLGVGKLRKMLKNSHKFAKMKARRHDDFSE